MNRSGLPSTRIRPHMACVRPVQCFGHSSYKSSVIDQQLVYGSIVTSGTAGGRNVAADSGRLGPDNATQTAPSSARQNPTADIAGHRDLQQIGACGACVSPGPSQSAPGESTL